MDKLKVINPTAIDLGEAFGIPQDRMHEISCALDDMVNKAMSGELRLVYTVDIINHIRSVTSNEEEFTWAYHNHVMWLARTGRLFTTREAQDVAMKQFGNPQNL